MMYIQDLINSGYEDGVKKTKDSSFTAYIIPS